MRSIRPSQDQDLAAITAIYRHHVLHSTGTFEIDPPRQAEMAQRRQDVLTKGLPYLVAEVDGQVLGFAYCNWFKPRQAYQYCTENSIYVAPNAQRQGWGRALLQALCHSAEQVGVRKMVAVIGDSANAGSIGVHRALGFGPVGTLTSCGWKFERWLDIVLMEKVLGSGGSTPP